MPHIASHATSGNRETARLEGVKELDLGHSDIGPEDIKKLAGALKEPASLQMLILNGNNVDAKGAIELADALATNRSLQILDLGNNSIEKEGAQALAEALKQNDTLQILNLGSNAIGSDGANALAEMLDENKSLRCLDLWKNAINEIGAWALADALKRNNTLQTLNLSNNDIQTEGAAALAAVFTSNVSLHSLHLGSNCIDHMGIAELAGVLRGNKSLHTLNLRFNEAGDEGAIALANALAQNEALRTLDLNGAKVGPRGVKALADAVAKNTSLHTLNLDNTKVGDEGVAALANALMKPMLLSWTLRWLWLAGLYVFHSLVASHGEKKDKHKLRSRVLGYNEALQELVLERSDPHVEAALQRNRRICEQSQSSLMKACKQGDIDTTVKLATHDACIALRDNQNATSLVYACDCNGDLDSLDIVKTLFSNSGNLSLENLGIREAISRAHAKGRRRTLVFLAFLQTLPLAQLSTSPLRKSIVKLYDLGVRTSTQGQLLQLLSSSPVGKLGVVAERERDVILEALLCPDAAGSPEATLHPDLLLLTERVSNLVQRIRDQRRTKKRLENDLDDAREYEREDPHAKAKIPGLERKLRDIEDLYKLGSELRSVRARLLALAQAHHPERLNDMEWLKEIGMPRGVPQELSRLGLWMENVERTDFETLSEIACKPGKTVHHVKDRDGQELVLKSFHLANEEWSSRFYRQLEALAKLDSAYVVRILGAFMQDSQHSCILMPHYVRGDLAAWIRENPHADVPTRKRIAIGLLTGLHDIHSRNLVHCDIKPENVFLTPNLSPVLGDFDGVQMTNMTITQPLQTTIRYMAPELRRGDASKVSPAVDIFSAGVVLEELFRGREDTAGIENLVQNLKSEDPHRRPSALDAVRDSAFKDVPVAVKSCPICICSYPANKGISCRDGHYICNTCLSDTVHAAAEPNAHVRIERNCGMCCLAHGCEQEIPGHIIMAAVPDASDVLIGILHQHFQRDSAAEQEEEIQRRVGVALREHGIDPTTQIHIRAIQNEVLAMSCPGCSTVFLDFDGCCALKCASCPTYFCAWCLEGTGNDSQSCHSHVANCAAKPHGEDRFYGRKHVVQHVWASFRAKRLRTYMSSRIQDEEIRSKIREMLQPLLTPDIVGEGFKF